MSFEQLEFTDSNQLDLDKQIYTNIFNILYELYEASPKDIIFEKLESYKVIKFFEKSVLRIIEKNKNVYISVRDIFINDVHKNSRLIELKSELPWIRLRIDNGDDVFLYKDIFCNIFEDIMPDTFDCCSRYMQCSDQMKCIQPDAKLMRECRYRKKLLDGIVYYGVNRNV